MALLSEESFQDRLQRFTQEDMLGTGLRVSLALLGPIGAITGEFVTQFVPRQRMDRLHDFVEKLDERLRAVEEEAETFKARLQTPAYAALAETTMVAAVQTPSDERRRDFAALLKNGLTRPEAEIEEQHVLLRLLQQLSDPEVLVLAYYRVSLHASMGDTAPGRFREQHAAVLDVSPSTFGSSPEERRRWMMYEYYRDRLQNLGLLKDTEGIARSAVRRFEITSVGIALIGAIDRAPEGVEPKDT